MLQVALQDQVLPVISVPAGTTDLDDLSQGQAFITTAGAATALGLPGQMGWLTIWRSGTSGMAFYFARGGPDIGIIWRNSRLSSGWNGWVKVV